MPNVANALSIVEKFPENQFTLLVPIKTVAEISEIQRPVMNTVIISTNLDDKEIYVQEKAKAAYNSYPATPNKYALTKRGLTKLMKAAGIKIIESKPVLPTTCQKCSEVNRSIGKPVNCYACGNDDVKHMVRIRVPQLTGEDIDIISTKEIIVKDVTSGMSDKQKDEFMKFRSEMCESKALNRALRTAMQIKSTYLIEEFKKPFVVAYLVPNLDNPDVKQAAIANMMNSSNNLYGEREKVHNTIVINDDIDNETVSEGNSTQPYQEVPPPTNANGQAPINTTASSTAPELVCTGCNCDIDIRVSDYSIRQYGKALCRTCQKGARRI